MEYQPPTLEPELDNNNTQADLKTYTPERKLADYYEDMQKRKKTVQEHRSEVKTVREMNTKPITRESPRHLRRIYDTYVHE